MGAPIVVEIRPDPLWLGFLYTFGPRAKFIAGVIMAIPPFRAMKTYVNVLCGHHQLIGKSGSAARTENDASLPEGIEHFGVPPALVAKLHHVAKF